MLIILELKFLKIWKTNNNKIHDAVTMNHILENENVKSKGIRNLNIF